MGTSLNFNYKLSLFTGHSHTSKNNKRADSKDAPDEEKTVLSSSSDSPPYPSDASQGDGIHPKIGDDVEALHHKVHSKKRRKYTD